MRSLIAMTYDRWNRIVEWPLAGLAAAFLLFYAWLVIGRPRDDLEIVIDLVMLVIWSLFACDYLVRLLLAPARGRWFLHHLHLLAIVALPFFRPLYLLRLVALLSVLQRATGTALRGRVTLYVVASATLMILIAALGVLDAEQNAPGALIVSFGDALWWAFTTITTVGYGDLYPVTVPGRLIAVGLMIAGVALLGSVTAALASWFVERVNAGRSPVLPDGDTPTSTSTTPG